MGVYRFYEFSPVLQQMNRNCIMTQELALQNINDLTFNPSAQSRKQRASLSGDNSGKWSELQHVKYIVYMEFHKNEMRSKENRRSFKLYKQMAKFVMTRDAQQCRSHHQKLEEKYHYPNKIIANHKQRCDMALYRLVREELTEFQNRSSGEVNLENREEEEIVRVEADPQSSNVVLHIPEVVAAPARNVQIDNVALGWPQWGMAYQQGEMLSNWMAYNCSYFPNFPIYSLF